MPIRQSKYNCDKSFAHSYGTVVEIYPKVRAAIVKRNDIQRSMRVLTRIKHRLDFHEQKAGRDSTYASIERRAAITQSLIVTHRDALSRIERSMSIAERNVYFRYTGVQL